MVNAQYALTDYHILTLSPKLVKIVKEIETTTNTHVDVKLQQTQVWK